MWQCLGRLAGLLFNVLVLGFYQNIMNTAWKTFCCSVLVLWFDFKYCLEEIVLQCFGVMVQSESYLEDGLLQRIGAGLNLNLAWKTCCCNALGERLI